jgi:hypothetical protein
LASTDKRNNEANDYSIGAFHPDEFKSPLESKIGIINLEPALADKKAWLRRSA